MTIAEWAVFAAVLLYLLTLVPVKAFGYRTFDNANPRDPAFYADAVRGRVNGAHINGIETLPFFAAAVLLAEFRRAEQSWIDGLAVGFMIVRLLFVIAYVGNRPTVRTLLWNLGFALNTAIFFAPWWARGGR